MAVTSFMPTHILDLLENAATTERGLHYLENGWDKSPTTVFYSQLYKQAQENASLLQHSGIVQQGRIVITYFDTHRENVLWLWSVVAAGGICAILNPVSNEPKTAAGQLENIRTLFGDAPVLTNHRLASIFASKGLSVKTVEQLHACKTIDSVLFAKPCSTDPEEIAAILFTSGSTGHSKAVKFSHGQLIASVQAKSSYLSSTGMTFMSWISFDHSACFCEIHLQALFNACDQYFVPPSELVIQPSRFFHVLSLYKIGYTFSPNFFLAAALDALSKQHDQPCPDLDLSKLAVIMCGGEANRTKTLEVTDEILQRFGAPKNTIRAAYGLSETCSACFYNLNCPEYDAQRGSVFASAGKHLPDVMEMKIVPREDDGSHDGSKNQGLIYLRGPLLFKGYHNNDAATQSCMTDDGWMNTGDIGELDENGNLHLLGRQKEVLILNGNNYSSFEVEHAIESSDIPGLTVSFTAVFSTWNQKSNSEIVIVLFNPTEAAIGPKNLRATIQAIEKCVVNVCAQKPLHVIPLPKTLLPKSTIGKLSRAKLKSAFEGGSFDDYVIESTTNTMALKCRTTPSALNGVSTLQREIAQIYSRIVDVPPENLLGKDALFSSGINSLGFIRLKKALESGLKIHQEIPMQLLLRCHSIAELEHELTLLGTVSQQYEPIVPLAKEGSKQPLFLLHPGAGEFLCWVGLLQYLNDRPVYALRARGLHPGEGTFNGLQDLLECYYSAIRRVQPKGPYAFLGYCFGGLLSFELGKMFEAEGETVNFCGGMDNPPCLKRTIGQVRYRNLMIDLLPVVTDLTEEDARALEAETLHFTDEEFYAMLFTKFSPEFIENMDITVPRLQAFGRVEDSMRLIADSYVPQGKVLSMDIFRADPMPHFGATPTEWKNDILGEWREYVNENGLKFHDVKGTHISLIKEPCIVDFQQVLNAALAERGI